MKKGIFFGLTTVDIISYVSRPPWGNKKLKAQGQLFCAGGPAANASITFRNLGNQSVLYTALGEHPLAVLAKRDLKHSGQ